MARAAAHMIGAPGIAAHLALGGRAPGGLDRGAPTHGPTAMMA